MAIGLHLGIGGMLTFRRSDELRAIVRDMPLERLILETNSPYLAPVPMRGKTNEPAFTAHVATRPGRAQAGRRPGRLEATDDKNFFALFGKAAGLPRRPHEGHRARLRHLVGRAADRLRLRRLPLARTRATSAAAARS